MKNSSENKSIKNVIVTPKSHVLLKITNDSRCQQVSPAFFDSRSDDYVRFNALCNFLILFWNVDIYLCGKTVLNELYYHWDRTNDIDIIVVGSPENLRLAINAIAGKFKDDSRGVNNYFSYGDVSFRFTITHQLYKNLKNPNFNFEEKIILTPANTDFTIGFRQFDICFITPETLEKSLEK